MGNAFCFGGLLGLDHLSLCIQVKNRGAVMKIRRAWSIIPAIIAALMVQGCAASWEEVSQSSSDDSSESRFLVNKNGQTYGSLEDVSLPEDYESMSTEAFIELYHPELVAVVASNGKSGYVYSKELFGPFPASPDEAKTMAEELNTSITVYEVDGVTPIGVFERGSGSL